MAKVPLVAIQAPAFLNCSGFVRIDDQRAARAEGHVAEDESHADRLRFPRGQNPGGAGGTGVGGAQAHELEFFLQRLWKGWDVPAGGG